MLEKNRRHRMSGLKLLASVPEHASPLAFFDPQHRTILNRQKYGNEAARQKRRAELPHMDEPTIAAFVHDLERVLRPSGHLMLWVDKYLVAERLWAKWLPGETELRLVDLIGWDSGRMGLGRRSRNVAEYLLVLQRAPIRAKDHWTDHGIRDMWPEAVDEGRHAHVKPRGLIRRLICATTKPGDLVLDPAAGSYAVLEQCLATGRDFLGCDIAGARR